MILRADARCLPLRDGCVECCVTSPPYFGLRDYGDPAQIGLEPTPEAYVAALVGVFREVRRVLKDDGTVWINLGDSYNAHPGQRKTTDKVGPKQETNAGSNTIGSRNVIELHAKNLIGIPWRVAFALQADGWYLRSDIIWAKPNPMPESVTDRPTKAHEYVFLLAKSARYYYDAAAIAEQANLTGKGNARTFRGGGAYTADQSFHNSTSVERESHGNTLTVPGTRNCRTVWTIATEPYSGAHFATFPEKLIEPCILAGCPVGGLVLDPFCGSGTVGAVALRWDRRWVGTDLAYHTLAQQRAVSPFPLFSALAQVVS